MGGEWANPQISQLTQRAIQSVAVLRAEVISVDLYAVNANLRLLYLSNSVVTLLLEDEENDEANDDHDDKPYNQKRDTPHGERCALLVERNIACSKGQGERTRGSHCLAKYLVSAQSR